MNEFLEIVTQRPEHLSKSAICPYCNKTATETGSEQTLVGDDKYNHFWIRCHCSSCARDFSIEHKGGNVWIVSDHKKVLKGIPTCWETYVYTCGKCNGDVYRRHVDKVSHQPLNSVVTVIGDDEQNWVAEFKCDQCGVAAYSENEYYYSESVLEYLAKRIKSTATLMGFKGFTELAPGWVFVPQPDIVCIHNVDAEGQLSEIINKDREKPDEPMRTENNEI